MLTLEFYFFLGFVQGQHLSRISDVC